MSKNNSSLIHFHIVVQCSQWCKNESQLALKSPFASGTRGKNQNLSNIACTIGAKEACAHIFQLLAHICFEMGTHSPPYSSWGWPTKTSQRARGKKYHVLQPLANSLSAVWGMFLKNRKIFPVFCFFNVGPNTPSPPWPTFKRILEALIIWALIGLPKALILWQSHLELKSSDNVCNALNWDHRRLQVVFPRAAIIRNLFSTVRVLHCGEMFSTVIIWGQVRWYKDHDVRSSSKQGSS